MMGATSGAGTI